MTQADEKYREDPSVRVRGGVLLQLARTQGRAFEPHFHEQYQLMLIIDGALLLSVEDAEHIASPGDVCVIEPGQVHGGRPLGWGWACRIFYVESALMEELAAEFDIATPHFAAPVIHDRTVARSLAIAHASTVPEIKDLRQGLALMLVKYAQARHRSNAADGTRAAEAHIRAHFDEKIALDELAALSGYSRFHFLRVFAREWGLTPRAYQTQLRNARAMRLLHQGASAAQAAQEAGFFDQSHLIRALRRSHGLTPGLVRRAHERNCVQCGARSHGRGCRAH